MLLCMFVFFSTALNDPSGLAVQVRHLVEIREHHIVCKGDTGSDYRLVLLPWLLWH